MNVFIPASYSDLWICCVEATMVGADREIGWFRWALESCGCIFMAAVSPPSHMAKRCAENRWGENCGANVECAINFNFKKKSFPLRKSQSQVSLSIKQHCLTAVILTGVIRWNTFILQSSSTPRPRLHTIWTVYGCSPVIQYFPATNKEAFLFLFLLVLHC